MEIRTLADIELNELLDTFNLSFSDYIVPLQLSMEQLEQQLNTENYQPLLSAGAFKGGKLIGFVLHGLYIEGNTKTLYNAGTGVVPAERGQRIISRLYDFILSRLKAEQVNKIVLEVISGNEKAIRAYKRIGFTVTRTLDCYKGEINTSPLDIPFRLKNLVTYDWDLLQAFWDWTPSYQNSMSTLWQLSKSNVAIGLYTNDILVGYLIYNPQSKRVQQFAVNKEHRNLGIGKALFGHIAQAFDKEANVINVDSQSKETKAFLETIGLKCFIQQFEMALHLE